MCAHSPLRTLLSLTRRLADRMPVPLGDFISKHVYDSRLRSSHDIKAHTCIKFVDVRKGAEDSAGSSWKVRLTLPPHTDIQQTVLT